MSDKKKLSLKKLLGLSALYIFGPLFITLTNPTNLPIALLVIPFIWLFAVIFASVWLVLKRTGQPKRRRSLIAGAAAALPVLLLVFQSIHQLSIKDVLLAVVLLGAVTFYLSKADFL